MEQEYTITAFTENAVGLLSRITVIFTRRHLNIESLTVSASALKNIHKFTIVVSATIEQVEKLVSQIAKLVDVVMSFYHTNEQTVYQELALYKVPTQALLENRQIEKIVRTHGARILEVTPQFTAIELTGHKSALTALFNQLDETCGVLQFTSSGRIAILRTANEPLSEYLEQLNKRQVQNCIEKISGKAWK
ncbi:MAG: acetolactate synthase small subunit [Bacteroidales bacterium]